MKRRNLKIKKWKIVCSLVVLLCLVIAQVLLGIADSKATALMDQSEGERWSAEGDAAQISCFFSVATNKSDTEFLTAERQLDAKLVDAGILKDEEKENARQYASAYSATGQVSISSKKTNVTVDALGVGGDFFLFHPVELLSGNYFSGQELNQDYIILDETTAWQLYGSSDITGQLVYIGMNPLVVRGVYKQDESRMAQSAGLNAPIVFVSYSTLDNLGTNYGLNCYEIVMPNPIKDFAKNTMLELLGSDSQNVEVIDSSNRFSLVNRLKVMAAFGTRSMNGKAIIYPYWENIARGVEDQVALLTAIAGLFLLGALVLVLILILHWWYHKGWNLQDKLREIGKKLAELPSDIRDAHRRKKAQRAQEENDYESI
jgi:hypothetical protein